MTAQIPPSDATQRLMQDWITLWHSELAALAVDREAQEGWQHMVGLWAEAARGFVALIPLLPQHEPAAGTVAAAGAAPAAAASDAGDAALPGQLERLVERVAELERRLLARDP